MSYSLYKVRVTEIADRLMHSMDENIPVLALLWTTLCSFDVIQVDYVNEHLFQVPTPLSYLCFSYLHSCPFLVHVYEAFDYVKRPCSFQSVPTISFLRMFILTTNLLKLLSLPYVWGMTRKGKWRVIWFDYLLYLFKNET